MTFCTDKITRKSMSNIAARMATKLESRSKSKPKLRLWSLSNSPLSILISHTVLSNRQTFRVWTWKIGRSRRKQRFKGNKRSSSQQAATYALQRSQHTNSYGPMSRTLITFKQSKNSRSQLRWPDQIFRANRKWRKKKRFNLKKSKSRTLWRKKLKNNRWRSNIEENW